MPNKSTQQIVLARADIVIIADAHNPSILSPQWLREKGVITEDFKNFVYTPEFSLFESESFSLIADRQRLQITAKKKSISSIEALAEIGKAYIRLLPHIPYKALGLNFIWHVTAKDGHYPVQIKVALNSISDISRILPGHELRYGCIIYAIKEPYMLRVTIEPRDLNLVYNFNYHHELQRLKPEEIQQRITAYRDLYIHSKDFVERTLKKEG